jgi:hypothetical protein
MNKRIMHFEFMDTPRRIETLGSVTVTIGLIGTCCDRAEFPEMQDSSHSSPATGLAENVPSY